MSRNYVTPLCWIIQYFKGSIYLNRFYIPIYGYVRLFQAHQLRWGRIAFAHAKIRWLDERFSRVPLMNSFGRIKSVHREKDKTYRVSLKSYKSVEIKWLDTYCTQRRVRSHDCRLYVRVSQKCCWISKFATLESICLPIAMKQWIIINIIMTLY